MPSGELYQAIIEITTNTLLWSSMATLFSGIPAIGLAWLLVRKDFSAKAFVSSIVNLPLVLPPTAVGFLLLDLLAQDGLLGRLDLGILLSPQAVVLACAIMSFPLIVRTARVAFESVDPGLEAMAHTLGFSPLKSFWAITVPLAMRGLVAALILGFTRCIGEFGASVIIAGNIPGRTQTLASAIYSAQQSGNEDLARVLLWIAVALGFIAVYATELLTRNRGGQA
ncbi:MAG: molybdate ABC transporter permease subunit [Opitutales bacterium]